MKRQRYRTRPVHGQKRSIPLNEGDPHKADDTDYKNWYRCWNCGFRVKYGRDSLGGERSQSGVGQEEYTPLPDQPISVVGGLDGSLVAQKLDAAGNPLTSRVYYKATVSGGCPLCGTVNWK